MSNVHSLKGSQARTGPVEEYKRLEEKRRSLEEKTRILEEKARVEKLAIDKKLLTEILQEENRTHDAAVKELEEKIATLEQQGKPSLTVEDIQNQTPSEPTQEVSDNVNENVNVEALQETTPAVWQESNRTPVQSEVEAPQETTKKKKRSLF